MKIDEASLTTPMIEIVRPMAKTCAYVGVGLFALTFLGGVLTAHYSKTRRDRNETWIMLSPLAIFGGLFCIPAIYLALKK